MELIRFKVKNPTEMSLKKRLTSRSPFYEIPGFFSYDCP